MPNISDHYDGEKFFNTTMNDDNNHSFFTGLKMWLFAKKTVWPKWLQNTATPQLNQQLSSKQFAVTFVNHATFLIQIDGLNILTDPIWSQRCSPFSWLGPKRVRDPGIAFADLPKIDLVLISHNHYDHLDIATVRDLNDKFAPQFIVPLGRDKALLQSLGCKNVQELDWWQNIRINDTTKIIFTPTQHFSARTFWDKYRSLWGAYVIESADKRIYFGGDAGYSMHFAEIYKRLGAMDLSLLGIGAYEPRWFMKVMHTKPEEAAQAHLDLHSKNSIGMHFGTFQLSTEAIDQPVIDLQLAIKEQGLPPESFITINEGATKIYSCI